MNWYRIMAVTYILAAGYLLITTVVAAHAVVPGWHTRVWTQTDIFRMVAGGVFVVMAIICWWLGRKKKQQEPIRNA